MYIYIYIYKYTHDSHHFKTSCAVVGCMPFNTPLHAPHHTTPHCGTPHKDDATSDMTRRDTV